MNCDAFSKCHPAVNFIYFLGAICFGLVIQHPAYILAGSIGALIYYLLLKRKKAGKTLLWTAIIAVVIIVTNPLFNTRGERVLMIVFGRPYTLEALIYGMVIAGIFINMMLWFGCYNEVMTSDKFTALFGRAIPSLSLLLVMILRMVPGLMRKGKQISGARCSIGKGIGKESKLKDRISGGMTILSTLITWALEGSIVTADSMRSRGYGSEKRTSFMIYRITVRDTILSIFILLLAAGVIAIMAAGGMSAEFTPVLEIMPISGKNIYGFISYCIYLIIPTILYLKESIQWRISISRI